MFSIEPTDPLPDEIFEATLDYIPEIPADILRLIRLTGTSPQQACRLFWKSDLDEVCDRRESIWIYRPSATKNRTKSQELARPIGVGPQAQLILEKYQPAEPDSLWDGRYAKVTDWLFNLELPDEDYKLQSVMLGSSLLRQLVHHACDDASLYQFNVIEIEDAQDPMDVDDATDLYAGYLEINYPCMNPSESHEECHWNPSQLRHTWRLQVRETFGDDIADALFGLHWNDSQQTRIPPDQLLQKLAKKVAERIG